MSNMVAVLGIGGRVGNFDPADRLPEPARRRIEALREQRADLSAVANAAVDKYQEAVDAWREAKSRFAQLTDREAAVRSGLVKVYGPEHPVAIEAKAKLDAAAEAKQRAEDARDARGHRWQQAATLVDSVESWLNGLLEGVVLKVHSGAGVKPRKAEGLAQAIERARNEVATLQADLHTLRSAPIPSAEAWPKIVAEVEKLAERGRVDLFELVEHGGKVKWPQFSDTVSAYGADAPSAHLVSTGPDGLALSVWLHKPALLERLRAELAAIADDANALGVAERQAGEADLLGRILQAERAEADLVELAAGEILHRPDIDPRAALGVVGPAPREI